MTKLAKAGLAVEAGRHVRWQFASCCAASALQMFGRLPVCSGIFADHAG